MKATKANTGGRPERQHGKRRSQYQRASRAAARKATKPISEGVPSGSTESISIVIYYWLLYTLFDRVDVVDYFRT